MRKLSVLMIILLMAGCATTSVILTGTRRAPVSPDMVKMYPNFPEKYEKIASITAEAEDGWTENHKVQLAINALKKKAAELGANGVVITNSDSTLNSANVRTVGSTYSISFERSQKVTGEAIYVPGP